METAVDVKQRWMRKTDFISPVFLQTKQRKYLDKFKSFYLFKKKNPFCFQSLEKFMHLFYDKNSQKQFSNLSYIKQQNVSLVNLLCLSQLKNNKKEKSGVKLKL